MLFLSHSKEWLVDRLAENLHTGGSSPSFNRRWILLPGQAEGQWLQLALVERSPKGAILGLVFSTWQSALLGVSRSLHPVPDEFELRVTLGEKLPTLEPWKSWIQAGPNRLNALSKQLSCKIKAAEFYGITGPKSLELGPLPCEILKEAKLPQHMEEIHCFCIDEMPPVAWDFFSQGKKVFIYLFSPCRMYWEDLSSDRERISLLRSKREVSKASLDDFEALAEDTHPLLANWGRVGRNTLRLLGEKNLTTVEDNDLVEGETLLGVIKEDLLSLRTTSEPPRALLADSSLSIVHGCSSKMREVEILREHIAQFLNESGAKYSDVLVLAPNIGLYEPLIHFVFGGDLPFRISPISMLPQNSFCRALLKLFDLGDFEVDDLLELFENPSFQAKQGISCEDLEWFRTWLEEAKVRHGEKEWEEGLRRMVRGLASLSPQEEGPPRIESIDWGLADKLDLFMHLIERIQVYAKTFPLEEKKTMADWKALFEQAAGEFLQGEEDSTFRAFLLKMSKISSSHLFPFSLISSLFADACASAWGAFQASSLETIQFASLQPGAIRPARAIFLLGLDAESFPRKFTRNSFDWETKAPDISDVDRYLFLQVIFAAKERLCISYTGEEPSLSLEEFSQFLESFYSVEVGKTDRALSYPAPSTPLFWPRMETERTGVRVMSLSDLTLLTRNPWKYFLQKKLGIFLKEESLFSERRLDDFSLPPYLEQRFLKESLQTSIETVIDRHRHQLPPGAFGQYSEDRLKRRAKEWNQQLGDWGISNEEIRSQNVPLLTVDFSKELQVQIVGHLDATLQDGLLVTGDVQSLSSTLRYWPSLLSYLAVSKRESGSLYSLSKGKKKTFEGIDVNRALHSLIAVALRSEESLSPLIDPWADAFLRKGKEAWQKVAGQQIERREDLVIDWVLARARPLPLDQIWEEWGAFLQEAFSALL
jgi:exodeoxyribonuclease V gamma subunit